ncbi:MAG: hypothetical protein NC305_10905 [Lachnospiraceae bacterium]|nr:hypothetical protein [Butyrivibrio sp.]MCM1343133.1 hypothetical protein [Muribaculaceae bacterium]MCM1411042.1 hypothetical protein [Lachnospiraceae bacterium]
MARKKVVLFIVEGVNDKTCLESVLRKIINSNEVSFQITEGDITSKNGMDEFKICTEIGKIVKSFKDKYHLKPEHFMEVVHIIDTDGAFIDDSSVTYADVEETQYFDDGIKTKNVDNIVSRNHQKRAIIERMLKISAVLKTVPYHVFYFSSNMDHVLHGKANMDQEDKNQFADRFEDRYAEDPKGFLKLMCESAFTVNGTYEESWEYIKADNNSVCQHCNFSVYLEQYRAMTPPPSK